MRRLREPANGLTHLAGALLAVAALAALLRLAAGAGTARHVVVYAVFGASLVALYTCAGREVYPRRDSRRHTRRWRIRSTARMCRRRGQGRRADGLRGQHR